MKKMFLFFAPMVFGLGGSYAAKVCVQVSSRCCNSYANLCASSNGNYCWCGVGDTWSWSGDVGTGDIYAHCQTLCPRACNAVP
ncbi:MAG: hypothetical protein LBL21_04345 [Rickettsiales bacterium]|jgi:hypothetical protein|nr:hypothetical protein [Rickettsiales bacterium]